MVGFEMPQSEPPDRETRFLISPNHLYRFLNPEAAHQALTILKAAKMISAYTVICLYPSEDLERKLWQQHHQMN